MKTNWKNGTDTEQEFENGDSTYQDTNHFQDNGREEISKKKDGTDWKLFPRSNKLKIIKPLPGSKKTTKNLKDTKSIWIYFVNNYMLNILIENTNIYILI